MKSWRTILVLLIVAAIAAFGWHWVAADPGYVLIRVHDWRLQTSLIVAIVALLLIWAILTLIWRSLRWPFGAARKRQQRVGAQRMARGMVALHEGRHAEAQRSLTRAAKHGPLRAAAQLACADAARAHGATARALELLDEADEHAPQAARVLRARTLREAGRADAALALLAPDADKGSLTPAGWHQWVLAALAAGQPHQARTGLEPLRKSGALDGDTGTALAQRVLLGCIEATTSNAALQDLWRGATRQQRSDPALIAGYARRADQLGAGLAAIDVLERALKRHWDDKLLAVYADIDAEHPQTRLEHAEQWLAAHAEDALLLTTVGRLCAQQGLWGKARDYLHRALSLKPNARAWEALGDVAGGQHDFNGAARCYHNALVLARGGAVAQLPAPTTHADGAPQSERRNALGLPLLPDATDE